MESSEEENKFFVAKDDCIGVSRKREKKHKNVIRPSREGKSEGNHKTIQLVDDDFKQANEKTSDLQLFDACTFANKGPQK